MIKGLAFGSNVRGTGFCSQRGTSLSTRRLLGAGSEPKRVESEPEGVESEPKRVESETEGWSLRPKGWSLSPKGLGSLAGGLTRQRAGGEH